MRQHTLNRVSALVQASGQTGNRAAVRAMVVKFDLGHSRHLKALQFVTPEGLRLDHVARLPRTRDPGVEPSAHSIPADASAGHRCRHWPSLCEPYDSQWVIPVARTMYASNGTALGVVGSTSA